jgi:hypothetical protein
VNYLLMSELEGMAALGSHFDALNFRSWLRIQLVDATPNL